MLLAYEGDTVVGVRKMRIAQAPSLLSPAPRDVDFLRWHTDRQRARKPPIGKPPLHKKLRSRPASSLAKPIGFGNVSKDVWKSASEYMSTSTLSFDSVWSEDLDRKWAANTDSKWRKHKKQLPRLVMNEPMERAWSKGIFEGLPHVGPHRPPSSPLARLTQAASAPDLNERPGILPELDNQHLPHSLRRVSSIESSTSAEHKNLTSRGSMNSSLDGTTPLPEVPVCRDTGKRSSALALSNKMKGSMGGMTEGQRREKAAAFLGADGHQHVIPSDLADLAHKWTLPLSNVTEASVYFKEYAELPGFAEEEDILRDGILRTDELMKLVLKLAAVKTDELSATPEEIMGIVDKNMDGSVDFHEFSCWYHERAFLEYMNLTKEEIEVRRVGHRLGISVADMDQYKLKFDGFDTDKSGMISIDEFRELMHQLMKVTKDLRIPESRIKHFWQECDTDGSGQVNLEEFVSFFVKHFDPDCSNPMEDYYKAIRRV